MSFLSEDDYEQYQVRAEVLSILKISTTTLQSAENAAQEQMSSFLRTRYDVTAVFEATGDARNPLIIMYMIDLVLYHLHSSTATRVMPATRENRYKAAVEWLEKVNKERLLPDLPELPDTTPDPVYRFGSNQFVSSRW